MSSHEYFVLYQYVKRINTLGLLGIKFNWFLVKRVSKISFDLAKVQIDGTSLQEHPVCMKLELH